MDEASGLTWFEVEPNSDVRHLLLRNCFYECKTRREAVSNRDHPLVGYPVQDHSGNWQEIIAEDISAFRSGNKKPSTGEE